MATFKKFDNQQVYQLHTPTVIELEVGDLISYNNSSEEIVKVNSLALAKQAKDDGLELYIVAQSDAITYKNGTGYKSAKLVGGDTVNATGDHIVVAYRVETLSNIEGLEA
jgi:hypothetical protein